MTITNTLTLADGSTASNVFMLVDINTQYVESTGKAKVALSYWRSETIKNNGGSQVYPIVSNKPVSSCELDFTGAEIVKAGTNCTVADTFVYYKNSVSIKLNTLYGWNVNL